MYIAAALIFTAQLSMAQQRSSERRSASKSRSQNKNHTISKQQRSRTSHARVERKDFSNAEKSTKARSLYQSDKRKQKGEDRNVSRSTHQNHYRSQNSDRNGYRSGSRSKAKNHFERSYTRRNARSGGHGHINHYYHNKRKVRNLYYNYKRVPAVRMIYHTSWHRFYAARYPAYNYGHLVNHRLSLISGRQAQYHVGEVAAVFGRVYETYYDDINNEFYLYFGAPYPQNDFTVVVTGREARKMRRHSPRYYIGRDFIVSGLVTQWNGNPEIVINYSSQLKRY
jgi:hypothetical protein